MARRGRSSFIVLLLFLTGCAAGYAGYMKGSLRRMERRDYQGALAKLEKPSGDTNKLLYRFEKGLILHYKGDYETSNLEFEKAERLIDQLYTRSASREIASLITNDAIRPYSGEEFERVFIHYFRAMNYRYLGQHEEALVECRKANLRLEDYAQASGADLTYRNDAFLQYLTGLLFEDEGELNDAYVSYRDAEKGYGAYAGAFGLKMPRMLAQDLARLARRLGYEQEFLDYVHRYRLEPGEVRQPEGGEVIVFAETGFIPRKRENQISVPILSGDNTREVWVLSDRMVYRHRHPHRYRKVEYWLKVALPYYVDVPSQAVSVRLRGGGKTAEGVKVEDLGAIAHRSLREKEDTILLRTIARGLAKYAMTKAAEKQSEFLGVLLNIFGLTTEVADTRSWLSLPASVHVARFSLPPGTVDLVLEFLDWRGEVIEQQEFPRVEVVSGERMFLSHRSYH